MQAGGHGEALRRLADRLCAEFPAPASSLPLGDRSDSPLGGRLGEDDQELVATLREALASVAANLGAPVEEHSARLLELTLDGAEFVIRGELGSGGHERLLEMMPSFVFLAVLAVTDQDRALEASERTAELIEQTGP